MTGKSTLVRETLPDAMVFDLSHFNDYDRRLKNPRLIEESLDQTPGTELVVIDEIQKAPHLLDEVHRLIESRGVRFLLTGSSARKLRRGGVSLLGGRARNIRFHPFVYREIVDTFNLQRVLTHGTLPFVHCSEDPRRALSQFVESYLQQEILAEGLTRNRPAFMSVLTTAAIANANVVNFEKLSSDIQVPRKSVRGYYDVLIDTLLVHELPAWRESVRRKAVAKSKYYFFDTGVATFLQRRDRIAERTPEFGLAFESWIFHELRAWIDYNDLEESLHYWRSQSGFEVDFLIGDHTAIEVKATRTASNTHLRSLKALMDEKKFKRYLCVCQESRARRRDGIEILPFQVFLENLWQGEYAEGQ